MSFQLPYQSYDGDYPPDSFEDRTTKNLRAIERALNVQNRRIEHGLVDDDGTVITGDGFTVNKTGTGTYTLTFLVGFASAPTAVAGSPSAVSVALLATPTTIGVTVTDFSGTPTDAPFYLVAVL